MSMRITQTMLFSSTLWDIQRNSRSLSRLQEMLASGQKINRPSDDPAGMLRMIPIQADIWDLERNKENLELAEEILNTGADRLQEASDIMIRARTLALQGINGTLNSNDKRSLANEIDQLLSHMVGIGNSNRAGRYLFSGSDTRTAPFTMNNSIVSYNGDNREVGIEVSPGVQSVINIPGDTIFMSRNRGVTTYDGSTGATAGAGTDSGVGMDVLQVRHTTSSLSGVGTSGIALVGAANANDTLLGQHTIRIQNLGGGSYQASINGGPAAVFSGGETNLTVTTAGGGEVNLDMASFNATGVTFPLDITLDSNFQLSTDSGASWTAVSAASAPANLQVVDSVSGSVTNVDTTGINLAGDEQLTYEGTFDVFSTLISLRDALQNTHNLSTDKQVATINQLVEELDLSHDKLLNSLRDLGSRSEKLDLVRSRVSGMEVSLQDAMGDIRDIDLAETIMEMNKQETLFQTSLAVGSRVIQGSLMDYLR